MEETENPTSDPALDALEDAAAKLDEQGGEGQVEVDLPSAQQPDTRAAGSAEDKGPDTASGETESSATNAELKQEQQPKGERPRDPKTGKFLAATSKEETAAAPEKPETPYSKEQKELERQKSVLAGFQREKEEFRRQVEEFNARVAQTQAQRPQRATKE